MHEQHIELLGRTAQDKVTGKKGIITSVSFDLYGCIQAVVTPPAVDGEIVSGTWLDIGRLDIKGTKRVMPLPDFSGVGEIALGNKGPADKPVSN